MSSYKGDVLFLKNRTNKDVSLISGSENTYSVYCEDLSQARDLASFKRRIINIVNKLGFTDFIYRRIESGERYHAALMTLPDELIRVYNEENFYESDLMIAYAKQNTQPIFTSQVYKYICDAPFETSLTEINRGIEKLNSRFSFFEYYSIPMKAYNGNGNVQLAITQKGMGTVEFQSKIIPYQASFRHLCKAIDYVSTTRFATFVMEAEESRQVTITPKPLYILSKLANTDITIAELANELCISPITAHQHIAGARKALGVKTNIGAIKKAIKLNLISFH
ncbi:MAG: autoinducer binding domain-containing protein [Spongiibacteraceae bacterium]|nr:autoinducer binding domain-containing protein [Spongiibacteraceae bacterium]